MIVSNNLLPFYLQSFRDLTFITRDNMSAAVDTLVTIATDKYHKLTDVARFQLIWVVK